MAQDLESIVVGQTGKVYNAPLGTAAPVDTATAWAAGWIDLGTIFEDGLTTSFGEDTSDIKQWGGGVVRKLTTSSETTFQFIALESNAEVMERFYRSAPSGGKVDIKGAVRDPRMWGIDIVDGDNHLRYVIENGEITARGDVVYKADQAASYDFTVTAYQDANLVAATLYSDLASWT